MAGEGVERGLAGLSRATRRDVTWPNRTDLRLRHVPYTQLRRLAGHVT
jgi:hypothetical protein